MRSTANSCRRRSSGAASLPCLASASLAKPRWDVIIAEESSRLYRHHTKAGELFESAVDADVRVICTSDYIDTADDYWPDRLHMSQMQHARSNFYTRKRIRRAHDGLWDRGAAVGNTKIGYKRRPTLPAMATTSRMSR